MGKLSGVTKRRNTELVGLTLLQLSEIPLLYKRLYCNVTSLEESTNVSPHGNSQYRSWDFIESDRLYYVKFSSSLAAQGSLKPHLATKSDMYFRTVAPAAGKSSPLNPLLAAADICFHKIKVTWPRAFPHDRGTHPAMFLHVKETLDGEVSPA